MQVSQNKFISFNCKNWNFCSLLVYTFPLFIGAILLAGCTHHQRVTSAYDPVPPLATSPPTAVWLPINEKNHMITSIGTYTLPKAIPIPSRLTPLSPALAYMGKPSGPPYIIRIFFPASQEQSIYEWAQSTPTILAHPPGFHNYKRTNWFDIQDIQTLRISRLNRPPRKAPYGWTIDWSGNNKDKNYNGFSSVFWNGAPLISPTGLKRAKTNKWTPEYANNSPVRDEPRHISMNLALWRDHSVNKRP